MRIVLATVLIAFSIGTAGAETSGDATVPPIVQRAVAAYESEMRGVIYMQRHFRTIINAGIVKHTEESDSGLLLKDAVFVRAHYYRVVEDGKEFAASQIASRDNQTNEGWSAGKIFFKEPYDRRYLGDYQFLTEESCTDCPAGTVAVKFTSAKHDDQHGAGTMWVESGNAQVVKLTYVPYVFPPHANSGSVTETSSQVLPNLWYVSRIDETYSGRAVLLRGTGTFTGLMDHFERFATLAQGENALQDGTTGR